MQNNIKKLGNNIFVIKNNSNFYNDNKFYEELRIIKLQKNRSDSIVYWYSKVV